MIDVTIVLMLIN